MEEKFLDFILEAYKLKEIKRKGWIKKVKIKEAESVASHTFGMILISTLIFKDINLIKKILIHDLAEIKIGDLTPEEKNYEIKLKEKKSLKEILSILPLEIKKEIDLNINEKILKEIDRLDMAIQALFYKEKGYSREKLEEFIKAADKEIKNEKLRKIFEIVLKRFYK